MSTCKCQNPKLPKKKKKAKLKLVHPWDLILMGGLPAPVLLGYMTSWTTEATEELVSALERVYKTCYPMLPMLHEVSKQVLSQHGAANWQNLRPRNLMSTETW